MIFHVVEPQVILFFRNIIERHANEQERVWIEDTETKFKNDFRPHEFYFAFSRVGRHIGNRKLELSEKQLQKARDLREGFRPQRWSLAQLVRAYYLLLLAENKRDALDQNLKVLCETADIEEQVVIYKMLSLFPYPERLTSRATEGIRTNVSVVFDAVALENPYASHFLDQDQWNQMVLKAVFMQRPLYRIYGVSKRMNSELALMLTDFAHERWAAHRDVTPELWRFVGPYLSADHLSDFKQIKDGSPLQTQAFLLACSESGLPQAHQLLAEFPKIKKAIDDQQISWLTIGIRNQEQHQEQ